MDSERVDPPAAEADLAAREAAYETFVWDNLRRNYAAHFLHGMLGMSGFRLVNAPTFLPAYLFSLSGSNVVVGLALALQQAGGIVSPIVGAAKVEHRKQMLPAAMWMGGLARVQVLGMALAGWLLSGQGLIAALLAFMFLFGLFMGAQRVVFQVLLSKVIPLRRRGRLQAWRNAAGGLISAVVAYAAGRWLIDAQALGNGYSTTFLCAFLLTSAGLTLVRMLMVEPEPPTLREKTRFRDRMKDLPALVFSDRRYAAFMAVQMLAVAGRMALPFYVLYASGTITLSGANLGALSLAFLGAETVSNLLWGHIGDQAGFRKVMLLSLLLWVGATVLLLESGALAQWLEVAPVIPVALAFVGLGAGQCGYQVAAQTMVLEFGARDDLPMRIAFSTTAEGVMASAGPLVGGLLAGGLGYPALFWCSVGLLAGAIATLLAFVPEPRATTAG